MLYQQISRNCDVDEDPEEFVEMGFAFLFPEEMLPQIA
jgi:hypothetical protein